MLFETRYEDISNKIKPLIDGEYSNKFQELYAKVTGLSFRVYSKHQTLIDIMYVLGSNQLRVRTNKELKEKIRKGLVSNIMFLKGTSEDVKECYRLGK